MCRDCGGVRGLRFQLAAGSSAMHEVSHDLLFTEKLIRLSGEVIQAVLRIVSGRVLGSPCGPRARRQTHTHTHTHTQFNCLFSCCFF